MLKEALLNATGRKRIAFTVEQRQRLAIKGKALTPDEREACCQLVLWTGSEKRWNLSEAG